MKYLLLIYFDEAWDKLSLTARRQIYKEQLELAEQLTSNRQYPRCSLRRQRPASGYVTANAS